VSDVVDGRDEPLDGGGLVSRDADDSGLTRRETLSLSGTAVLAGLAGCGGRLPERLPGGSPATIDAAALSEATRGETPTVPETLPVDIEAAFVEGQRDTARSKLDATPAPFDEGTIPNGVIRERLNDEYDHALRSIRDASGALTAYERLDHATHARTSAHEVAAAWDAIESRLTAAALRESIPGVRDAVDAFARRRSYVGSDPVRAAVVHAELDREIRAARNWLSNPDRELESVAGQSLALAEVAADIERARAGLAVGSYLFDRHRQRLDGSGDLRDRLAAAHGTFRERIERRSDSMPPEQVDDPTTLVDRDVDATAGVHALAELGSDVQFRLEDARTDEDAPSLADDVMDAIGTLLRIRAVRRLRERIEGGDDVAIASATDVETLRSDAIAAVEAAQDADGGELVVEAILPEFGRQIGWIDDRFDRGSGSVRVESVSFDAMRYVTVAAVCRALPETAAEVTTVLRDAE
jgi:hypothetical protein